MQPIGPKLAEGRDSEIFEHGPGRVLRVNRVARDLRPEAEIMRWVRDRGYPVPEVFDAGDGWLIMERVDGVDMMDVLKKTPKGVDEAAELLADLHTRLEAIEAPEWLPPALGVDGDRVVHLDLHPMNVMITADGPVVIDWSNAGRGPAAMDVANTWCLLKCGDIPLRGPSRWLAQVGRGLLVSRFLARLDSTAACAVMPPIIEWRVPHPNHSDAERARMRRLARAAAAKNAKR